MKLGKTEQYIHERIKDDGAFLISLIDPADQSPEAGAKMAKQAYDGGTGIILVGGSVGAQGEALDNTCKLIKEAVDIPVVLFPGNIATLTPYADAVYFMKLFNSRNTYWMSTAPISAAPVVKRMGIEPIPTCYLVVEPGGAVGWVGDVNLLPRNRPYVGAASAMAGQYLGARLIVTDSGSGAETPAPASFVKAIASAVDVPYIYGGGVRKASEAGYIVKAGADAIQIGTAFEGKSDITKPVAEFVNVMKKAARARK